MKISDLKVGDRVEYRRFGSILKGEVTSLNRRLKLVVVRCYVGGWDPISQCDFAAFSLVKLGD